MTATQAHQTSAAPGDLRRGVRPPTTSDAAPSPGAVARFDLEVPPISSWLGHEVEPRTTARQRPLITPRPWPQPNPDTYATDHPYVRRYWTAVLGPGAVADLLRLATAAQRGRSLALPTHLATLLHADLARRITNTLEVKTTVPALPDHYLNQLHPRLRTEHDSSRRRVDGYLP